ncbi:MAG: hypothetical protein JWM57_139 [Phycisphaerales bacterium]|nr:hypothetical protein [Phycisphaerales bacterium]
MLKKYQVTLTPEERGGLESMTRRGRGAARTQVRARVLLKCDESEGGPAPADALECGTATVARVRQCSLKKAWTPRCGPGPRHGRTPGGWTGRRGPAGHARLLGPAEGA